MSFLEIFQPGLKHLREERDRQKMLGGPAVTRRWRSNGNRSGRRQGHHRGHTTQLEPDEPEATDTGPA